MGGGRSQLWIVLDFFLKDIFIYGLWWVSIAERGLCLVVVRGLLFAVVHGLFNAAASLVAEHGF